MCGHVLAVTLLWLQMRVWGLESENLGTFSSSPYPFITHDQNAVVGLLGKSESVSTSISHLHIFLLAFPSSLLPLNTHRTRLQFPGQRNLKTLFWGLETVLDP